MSVIVRVLGADHMDVYVKGAPEKVVSLCRPNTSNYCSSSCTSSTCSNDVNGLDTSKVFSLFQLFTNEGFNLV